MKKTLLLVALFMFASGFQLQGYSQNNYHLAQQESWQFMGDRVISFTTDKDLINVTGNDLFRKLKFKILDAPVFMLAMKVMFENGETQDIQLGFKIKEGYESRVIDLVGDVRRINVVYFNYKTAKQGYKGKAKLILFGQK